MKTVQKITELTEPPIVGKYYLVPTILHYWDSENVARPWPVFPPKHNDARFFNFERDHYHVDPRFIGARAFNLAGLGRCQTRPVAPWRYGPAAVELPGIVWRRLKCKRTTVDYQFGDREPVKKLRAHHAGQQCKRNKAGWVCPHQNWPMGSLEPDADGVITCPLHGLRIRAADGVVLEP